MQYCSMTGTVTEDEVWEKQGVKASQEWNKEVVESARRKLVVKLTSRIAM